MPLYLPPILASPDPGFALRQNLPAPNPQRGPRVPQGIGEGIKGSQRYAGGFPDPGDW